MRCSRTRTTCRRSRRCSSRDAHRISYDAPIHTAADLDTVPLSPRAVNIKPCRVGDLRSLFEVYEAVEARGLITYGGGMGELSHGRDQIQLLASLFHADGPNDTAPKATTPTPRGRPSRQPAAREPRPDGLPPRRLTTPGRPGREAPGAGEVDGGGVGVPVHGRGAGGVDFAGGERVDDERGHARCNGALARDVRLPRLGAMSEAPSSRPARGRSSATRRTGGSRSCATTTRCTRRGRGSGRGGRARTCTSTTATRTASTCSRGS